MSKTKYLIYIVGLRRSSGMKAGAFIYNDKHQKFIFENRELEQDEFNTLMAKQWPMQRMANQQVSGFAFTEEEAEALPASEPASEPDSDSESTADTLPASDEAPAQADSPTTTEPSDDEPVIPRNPRKASNRNKP